MYFENENCTYQIIVMGYTDTPERFSGNIGRNALSCEFSWFENGNWVGTMWDELFQTDDIIRLYDGIHNVLNHQTDTYSYRDKWDCVIMDIKTLDSNTFKLSVSVYDQSNGCYKSETFTLDENDLRNFTDELTELTKLFPVVD